MNQFVRNHPVVTLVTLVTLAGSLASIITLLNGPDLTIGPWYYGGIDSPRVQARLNLLNEHYTSPDSLYDDVRSEEANIASMKQAIIDARQELKELRTRRMAGTSIEAIRDRDARMEDLSVELSRLSSELSEGQRRLKALTKDYEFWLYYSVSDSK